MKVYDDSGAGAGEAGHILGLCGPVRYKVLRGLLKVNARQKLRLFRDSIAPLMDHLTLTDEDWQVAAQLWSTMRNRGRQFSDVDLLIAALPVQREDWRLSQ